MDCQSDFHFENTSHMYSVKFNKETNIHMGFTRFPVVFVKILMDSKVHVDSNELPKSIIIDTPAI